MTSPISNPYLVPTNGLLKVKKLTSKLELDHDFLMRTTGCLPEQGRIGIFNRSHYEETLVVRVHPQYLEAQRLRALAAALCLNEAHKVGH
jgi:polyphosphate kinase 2 (PPK2 family)